MGRIALALALVALAAGCGGSGGSKAEPEIALLEGVTLQGDAASFHFRSEPREIRARYVARSALSECGSGRRVRLQGTAFLVVHFMPAQSTGPSTHLRANGPALEAAKVCDFEADVGWAIGLSKRVPFDVSRDGGTVTVSFG